MNSLRRRYLAEIGIPVWTLRHEQPDAVMSRAPSAAAAEAVPDALPSQIAARDPMPPAGIGPLRAAPTVPAAEDVVEAAEATEAVDAVDVSDLWAVLRGEVSVCTRCALHSGRTQTVFGVGRQNARLMIVGEAPGAEEDRQGKPFVGPAGQLLNAMLRSIGFAREDVFIANILKCRPPQNRDPRPEETAACSGYLERQMALVRPQALLAVGRIAAQWLLQSDMPIGRLRGAVHRYGEPGVPLVVTYHPAYLLRTPLAKAKSWQDLCKVKDLVTAGPDTME